MATALALFLTALVGLYFGLIRRLSFRSDDGNWVWTFVLRAENGGTRLISRNRFRLPTRAARIGILPIEPGSLVMERKMLCGIRERAEGL